VSSQCSECGASVDVAARFCGECGASRDVPSESGAGIARYRQVLEGFVRDGSIGAREFEQLEVLRGRLGITRATHGRLISEVQPSAVQPDLRLWIDVSTFPHFAVGQRGLVRARVRNESDLAFESAEVRLAVSDEEMAAATTATIFPGEDAETSSWFTPKIGGFAELGGEIDILDLMGGQQTFRFSGLEFRIGGDGPQIQVVNIDQRSARVVDNSRSQFGSQGSGGVAEDRDWRPLQVVPVATPTAAPTEPAAADAGPVDFVVNTDSGRYHVRAVLGYGDVATVYGGNMDTPDGARRKVAVKIADDSDDNDLLQREARTLRFLLEEDSRQAKHLPVLLDQFKTPDNRCANVFVHLDGYDLLKVREKHPEGIPDVHLMWIFRRTLSVLGYAHSRGVLHGNIDPSHIVIRARDHNVWLVDWCWSVVNPAVTGDKFKALNEPYSAPEVAQRLPPIPPSDLYALGKCMIFAAGGDPETGDLPDRVDGRLARLLQFFTRPSPMQRAQDAWAMYTRLEALRDEMFGDHKFRRFEI
jgi:hypothetical protein